MEAATSATASSRVLVAAPRAVPATVASRMRVAMEEFKLLRRDRESTVSSVIKDDVAATISRADETLGYTTDVLKRRYFDLLQQLESVETTVAGLKNGKYRTVFAPDEDDLGCLDGGTLELTRRSTEGGNSPTSQSSASARRDHQSNYVRGGSPSSSPRQSLSSLKPRSISTGARSDSQASAADGVAFPLATMLQPEVSTGGDTITLRPGIYTTPLVVEGTVSGNGPQVITVQGHPSDCSMVTLDRTGEEIDGDDEVPFITVRGKRHLILRHLTIRQTPESAAGAIRVDGHSSLLMEDCAIMACSGPCVVAGKGSTLHLRRCQLMGTIHTCLKVTGADRVILEDCVLTGAEGCGVCVEGDLGPQQQKQEQRIITSSDLQAKKKKFYPENGEVHTDPTISSTPTREYNSSYHLTVQDTKISGFDGEGFMVKSGSSGNIVLNRSTIESCGRHCLELRDGYGDVKLAAVDCSFTEAGLSNVFLGVPAKKTAPSRSPAVDGSSTCGSPTISFERCTLKTCGMTSFYCALPMEALSLTAPLLGPGGAELVSEASTSTLSTSQGQQQAVIAAQWEILQTLFPTVVDCKFSGAAQFAVLLMLMPSTSTGAAHVPEFVEPSKSMLLSPLRNPNSAFPSALSGSKRTSTASGPGSPTTNTSAESDGFQQFLKATLFKTGNTFGKVDHPIRVVESTRTGVTSGEKRM